MQTHNLVTLYHGGHIDNVANLMYGGGRLAVDRQFFCTTNEALAWEASSIHGLDGSVLRIVLEATHYRYCVEQGLFEVREYLGVIQYDGAREVVVKPGHGIRVINESFPHEFRPVPNVTGVEKIIGQIEREKQK